MFFGLFVLIFTAIEIFDACLAYVGTHVKMADEFGDGLFDVFEENSSSAPIRRSDNNDTAQDGSKR